MFYTRPHVLGILLFSLCFGASAAHALDSDLIHFLQNSVAAGGVLNPPNPNKMLLPMQESRALTLIKVLKVTNPQWNIQVESSTSVNDPAWATSFQSVSKEEFTERLFELASAGEIPEQFQTTQNVNLFRSYLGGVDQWKYIVMEAQKEAFTLLLFGNLVPYEQLMDVAAAIEPQLESNIDRDQLNLKQYMTDEIDKYRMTIMNKKARGDYSRTWEDTLNFNVKNFCRLKMESLSEIK